MATELREVLHIDDDACFTALVSAQMLARGYRVRACNDARQAIQQITQHETRVVLLDLDLPHVNGLELLARMQQAETGVHVLVVTGLVSQQTVLEALHAGAEAVLFKPLESFEPLAAALDSAFRATDRWWETLRRLSSTRRDSKSCLTVD
jgi:CheY-like chemotaxis protein